MSMAVRKWPLKNADFWFLELPSDKLFSIRRKGWKGARNRKENIGWTSEMIDKRE
jgi:hypothetical protein